MMVWHAPALVGDHWKFRPAAVAIEAVRQSDKPVRRIFFIVSSKMQSLGGNGGTVCQFKLRHISGRHITTFLQKYAMAFQSATR
jgi:hypothetical protein